MAAQTPSRSRALSRGGTPVASAGRQSQVHVNVLNLGVVGQASVLQKLVEGELVVARPEPLPGNVVPCDAEPNPLTDEMVIVEYKGTNKAYVLGGRFFLALARDMVHTPYFFSVRVVSTYTVCSITLSSRNAI